MPIFLTINRILLKRQFQLPLKSYAVHYKREFLKPGRSSPRKRSRSNRNFRAKSPNCSFPVGRPSKKDELLAIIRQESSQARQVAQLREAIQEERLNVNTTQREWVRSQSLFKKGFIAQQELETSEDNYQRALLRLELAERQLLLALGGNEELFKRYQEGSTQSTRPEEFQVRSPIGMELSWKSL